MKRRWVIEADLPATSRLPERETVVVGVVRWRWWATITANATRRAVRPVNSHMTIDVRMHPGGVAYLGEQIKARWS